MSENHVDMGAVFEEHMRDIDGKVAHEHIYWDQASLLVQIGLLDPSKLPVTGIEQAKKMRDITQPMNQLLNRPVTR